MMAVFNNQLANSWKCSNQLEPASWAHHWWKRMQRPSEVKLGGGGRYLDVGKAKGTGGEVWLEAPQLWPA